MKVQQIERLVDLPAQFAMYPGVMAENAAQQYTAKYGDDVRIAYQYQQGPHTIIYIPHGCPRCGGETRRQGDLCRECLPL